MNNTFLTSFTHKNGAISGVNRDELEAKEKIILSEIETNLSTRELSENWNIPFSSVQRYISNLRENGFIERVGANKNGYWKVIKITASSLVVDEYV
ncbi:MAG: helix-turn-helix domain-containing protein [Candidatus Enterosoma sp.]|nr:helix-turn-helix domain-containing protein [Candidatus Enterosoma sp.]